MADQPSQFQQCVGARIAPVGRTLVGPARWRPTEITLALIGHARLTLSLGTVGTKEAVGHLDIEASTSACAGQPGMNLPESSLDRPRSPAGPTPRKALPHTVVPISAPIDGEGGNAGKSSHLVRRADS
jgi:hypothetical protein